MPKCRSRTSSRKDHTKTDEDIRRVLVVPESDLEEEWVSPTPSPPPITAKKAGDAEKDLCARLLKSVEDANLRNLRPTAKDEAEFLRTRIVDEAVKFGDGAQTVARGAMRLYDLFMIERKKCEELQKSAGKGTPAPSKTVAPPGGLLRPRELKKTVAPGKSYATAAAKTPEKKTKDKTPQRNKRAQPEHVVVVYPSEEVSPKALRKRLETTIGLKDLGVAIRKVALTNKGVLVKTGKAAEAGKLAAKISTTESLKATSVVPKRFSPRVLIRGVPPHITPDEVISRLREQFALGDKGTEVKYPVKRPKTVDWAVEVSGEQYKLIKGKFLMVGWSKCRIPDCIRPLQCYRCGSYGHRVKSCSARRERCFKCGKEGHRAQQCYAEETFCRNCRKANSQGFHFDTKHSMFSAQCPCRATDQRRIISRTNYGDQTQK